MCACAKKGECGSPGKHPCPSNGVKAATTDEAQVRRWWAPGDPELHNVAIACGEPSGVIVVDVDPRHGGDVSDWGLPTSIRQSSGGGGEHILFKWPGHRVRNRTNLKPGVDIKGDGGYILVAPSNHISGGRYSWVTGADSVLEEAPEWLLTAIERGSVRRGDRPALEDDNAPIMEGERNSSLFKLACSLRRRFDDDISRVGEAIMEANRTRCFPPLEEAEVIEIVRSAFAQDHSDAEIPRWGFLEQKAPSITAQSVGGGASVSNSWAPVDLRSLLSGGVPELRPTLLRRVDGVPLLYLGKVNSFMGEPESGKTWGALMAAQEAIAASQRVLYIDFENGWRTIVQRLLALGVPQTALTEQLIYVNPSDPFDDVAWKELAAIMEARSPELVIVDSVAEAMALAGLDPESNPEIVKWFGSFPAPLARLGAAVVLIDHVTKRREGRNGYAIGAQHKKGAIDGASYMFDVVEPFGRNRVGYATVSVTKDREGFVREHESAENVIAKLRLDSREAGVETSLELPSFVDFAVASAANQREQAAVLAMAAAISAELESVGSVTSKTAIKKMVSGKADRKSQALDWLIDNGYAATEKTGRGVGIRFLRAFHLGDCAAA